MIKRSEFILDTSVIFLNHGSFGACPSVLLEAQHQWQLELEHEPVAFFHALPERMRHAREALAAFVDAEPNDVVYVTNSTYGANLMAFSMARYLKPGDSVLLTDHEYGACRRAWDMHLEGTGITVDTCCIPLPIPDQEELEARIWSAITPATRAIFISHITSPTGCRMPIEGLAARARAAGILMLVDGAHTPGQLPLSLRQLNVDMYTGNCHKWMCTPKGSALLWVRRELQPHVLPAIRSWGNEGLSLGDGAFIDDHEYTGTRDVSPFLTTPSAIEWMNTADWWQTIAAAHELVRYGMKRLLEIANLKPVSVDWDAQRLLMGAVLLPKDVPAAELQKELLRKYKIQVVCHQWLDLPLLRFSVHGYSTKNELDTLASAVRDELMVL